MTVLILAEKPTAAKRIAEALAEGPLKTLTKRGISYYEFSRNGKSHLAVPSVGHLFGLAPTRRRWEYPVFDVTWKERYMIDRNGKFTQSYLENIKELAKEADEFINSCDYDIEGSTIAYNIFRFACGVKEAKRMRFSTLVKEDLVDAYEKLSNTLDWGLINAGLTRHFLDFYWGVNLSRALTIALNKAARLGFKVLSTGRVQAPTLSVLTEKEEAIEAFKPEPFWQIRVDITHNGHEIEGWYEEDKLWDKQKAERILEGCRGKPAIVSGISRKRYKHKPPTPFNLTDLQVEAYRLFGYTPDRTLNIAQGLYEMAAISYPRTSSQKLPPKIGYARILTSLSSVRKYEGLSKELLAEKDLRPREGAKKDPAHISIYPTTEVPKKLVPDQSKLYDLIVRRFMATFAKPAVRESMRVDVRVGESTFVVVGRRTLEDNWYRFYGPHVKLEEITLPDLEEGDELQVKGIEMVERETQPPKRFTPASLVKELENRGLGTKATRAEIIKTLFDRGYVMGRSIKVTKLGRGVTHTLKEYCPTILSEELTRKFEEEMELVEQGKMTMEEVLENARNVLLDILAEFNAKEKEIGRYLADELRKAERITLGPCPSCGDGELRVIYSKRTRKRFVGCSGYFEGRCNFSAPLPQRGSLEPLDRSCKVCGYPMILVKTRGRRPWNLCINPDCTAKRRSEEKSPK